MSLPLKHSNTGVNYLGVVHSDFIRALARSSQEYFFVPMRKGGKEGEKVVGIKLSAQCHSLPRPHKVKVARKEVNDTVQLSRIPDYDGSYRQVEVAVSEEISRILKDFSTIIFLSFTILVQVDTYLDLEALLN
eukprot:Em1319g1a